MTSGPPYPPYPPYPPPPPHQPPPRKISVAMVFVGAPIYIVINSVLGFAAFIVAGSEANPDAVLGGTAVLLGLIAFGGGAVLLAKGSPHGKGIGLGLMIGWALTSVVTVGICTGLNPQLYSS